MNCNEFMDKVRGYNTTLGVFIKLFNMWQAMPVEERGKAIEMAMKTGSLVTTK